MDTAIDSNTFERHEEQLRRYGNRLPQEMPDEPSREQFRKAAATANLDTLQTCFPQLANLLAEHRQRIQAQEKAKAEATAEAAKAPNRLKQAYFNYIFVKRCYDVRLGYQMVYINDVEMDRARIAVSQIETSILKEDSSINTSDAWQRAARNVEALSPTVDRYYCQTAYNDLLGRAPYSPPVKDFRGN